MDCPSQSHKFTERGTLTSIYSFNWNKSTQHCILHLLFFTAEVGLHSQLYIIQRKIYLINGASLTSIYIYWVLARSKIRFILILCLIGIQYWILYYSFNIYKIHILRLYCVYILQWNKYFFVNTNKNFLFLSLLKKYY